VFHPVQVVAIALVGAVLGLSAFYVYQLTSTLDAVAVEDFNPEMARQSISAEPGTGSPDGIVYDIDLDPDPDPRPSPETEPRDPRLRFPAAFGLPIPDEEFDSYLLLGTDASGFLADSIILTLQPTRGGAPIMVSLPRDLYVWNLCKKRFSRLNEGLGGCRGSASGPELMAIMVEDYTGIPVDYLARIDFDGFSRVVDVMGGITVCVDYPTRDEKAHLEITESGCQVVGGTVALAWVRSRNAEQFIDGEWRRVAGSDFARQRRQQDVLFQLAGKAAGFPSPAALTSTLSAVAGSVRLDSSWSFAQAVSVGWRYRGMTPDSVRRFTVEASNFRTSGGALVLVPKRSFTDQLARVYPLDGVLNS
jgi:LCP family protein required for cell wall assembly